MRSAPAQNDPTVVECRMSVRTLCVGSVRGFVGGIDDDGPLVVLHSLQAFPQLLLTAFRLQRRDG